MDVATFRANFPEFANETKYPSPTVQFWLDLGEVRCTEDVWSTMRDAAVQLLAAHALKLAGPVGSSGAWGGIIASKAVDKLSVSYDTTVATLPGAGAWNGSIYGVQFYQLVQMAGMGGMQLGAGPNLDLYAGGYGNRFGLP